jgi:hypothetical protein
MARLNADVSDELRKRLLHALVDENISFAEWLRRKVDGDLKERRKEKEEHRTNSMGLWTSARAFFDAASVVAKQSEGRISIPAYFLYCRSIELFLKAFLRARRGLGAVIRLRHDLDALMLAAEGEGLKSVAPLGEEQVGAIEMINPYYRGKELEYIVTGFKRLPQITVLHSCAFTLLEGTKRVCLEGRTAQVRKKED